MRFQLLGYRKRHADTSGIIFDMNSHSEKDLHLFKLSGIDLVVNVLQNKNLIEKVSLVVTYSYVFQKMRALSVGNMQIRISGTMFITANISFTVFCSLC